MSNLILPYRPLPPEGTGVLATRLDDVLARLPGLGIRLNPASRLPQAARLLRSVEEANAYPSSEPDLLRVTNAVKAAFNFVRVIDAIRSPGPPGMLESLRRAAKGTLDDAGPTPAHRAQSELFFGVATVAGGAKTGAPKPGGRKTPDFVTEVDTLRYSVEVKRPGSVNTVQDKVAEAVRQIRGYKPYPGLVALDFSDLLPDVFGIRYVPTAESRNQQAFRAAYNLAREYVIRHSSEAGYSRVALLICFAESFLWTIPNPYPVPHSAFMLYAEVFLRASEGLIVDQSRKLRVNIVRGFKEMGGHIRRLVRVP